MSNNPSNSYSSQRKEIESLYEKLKIKLDQFKDAKKHRQGKLKDLVKVEHKMLRKQIAERSKRLRESLQAFENVFCKIEKP